MRKLLFIFLVFLTFQTAQAQSKIGIKLSPTLSTNRIDFTDENGNYAISSSGVGGRFIFGPMADIFITDNYYFSTGLLYAPKRIGITVVDLSGTTEDTEQIYKLQYLQVPATLKLYTNELALDTRVYFQLGGILELKIADKLEDDYPIEFIEKTRLFDLSVHIGTGVEYRIGYNTLVFGGIFYNRGLVNAVTQAHEGLDINVKNDLVGLDLGIKF